MALVRSSARTRRFHKIPLPPMRRKGSHLRENPQPHTHRPQQRRRTPHRRHDRRRILLRRDRSHQTQIPRQLPTLPIRHMGMENRLQRTEPKRELQQHAQRPRRTRQTIMSRVRTRSPHHRSRNARRHHTTSNKQNGPEPPTPKPPHPPATRPHRPTPKPQPSKPVAPHRSPHRTGHPPNHPTHPTTLTEPNPSEQPRPRTTPTNGPDPNHAANNPE